MVSAIVLLQLRFSVCIEHIIGNPASLSTPQLMSHLLKGLDYLVSSYGLVVFSMAAQVL
ncbi:MAG: hypothetical protein R3C24_11355 [Cyanobacteriota/Melainabacteria group bacterium]